MNSTASNRLITLCLLIVLGAIMLIVFYTDAGGQAVAGWSALIIIPAALGALVSHLVDPQGMNSPVGCFAAPTMAIIAITGLAFLFIGEGAICIAMVLPLWIPAAIGGGLVQHYNARRRIRSDGDNAGDIFQSSWLALPLFALVLEQTLPAPWQSEAVSREVIVNAPADSVWPLLVSIPAIKDHEGRANLTQDILGVPRPVSARLEPVAGQLVRKAEWGKGIRFEERITRMEPGRAIGWTFAFPDDSVSRHTDRHISPDGPVLKILSGGYLLEPLPDGRTRVRLTTQYRMRSHLAPYLSLWGDQLLGDVEANVLAIIQKRAEPAER
ncbi:MAG: hypothetical protein ACKOPO_06915 [Novosphingobium sp.]